MKLGLPQWSVAPIAQGIETAPAGSIVELSAGPGAKAYAVRLDASALQSPSQLTLTMATALGVLGDPRTPKRIAQLTGAAKDFKAMGELATGTAMPFGGVVDGFAVLASGMEFWQAISENKGTLKIVIAGAEVTAGLVNLLWESPRSKMVVLGVDAVGKAYAALDKGSLPAATGPAVVVAPAAEAPKSSELAASRPHPPTLNAVVGLPFNPILQKGKSPSGLGLLGGAGLNGALPATPWALSEPMMASIRAQLAMMPSLVPVDLRVEPVPKEGHNLPAPPKS
jgi:hypothetical protein